MFAKKNAGKMPALQRRPASLRASPLEGAGDAEQDAL